VSGVREELIALRAELERLRDRVDLVLRTLETSETTIPISPDAPIEDLKLPRRALTCLHNAGIKSVGDLASKAYSDLWRMENCGKYTVRDIDRALRARGLVLKGKYLDGIGCPKRTPRKQSNMGILP
jgi:DNA-directed RNA polymerase alpha subunit